MSLKKNVETLTDAATRSFGRIVNVFKQLKNMGIGTYQTLYNSYVCSIMNYGAAAWGYVDQNDPQVLQNLVQQFYLGVNRYTLKAAVQIEFDWLDPKFQRYKKRFGRNEGQPSASRGL